MSTNKSFFQLEDFFDDHFPDPGYYPCTITSARFRRSSKGNRMLQVLFSLEGVDSCHQMLSDYFVLQGEQVTPSGIYFARRRLVHLYNACRLFPSEGDPIVPSELLNSRLQVRIDHQDWQGQRRLRVVAYRPLLPLLPIDPDQEISL